MQVLYWWRDISPPSSQSIRCERDYNASQWAVASGTVFCAHIHKIFRFQLKSDQHVFPVWTPMQLAWQSINYHDHSSLSCPLISWGSVKTETLPALCNRNNKPIDLIHLRCGWQLTCSPPVCMVSQENAPHQTLSQENVSFPNMHSSKTDGDWDCHTKMCEKEQIKLNAS